MTDAEIDIDEIIIRQTALDNKIIKDIIDNKDLKSDDIPKLNHILKIYNNHLIKDKINSFGKVILLIFHILYLLFIIFGIFLPNKFLPIHITICIITLILWEILNGKCYLSIIMQKISKDKIYIDLIPFDYNFCIKSVLFVMFISIFSLIFPNYSLFKIIQNMIEQNKIYN